VHLSIVSSRVAYCSEKLLLFCIKRRTPRAEWSENELLVRAGQADGNDVSLMAVLLTKGKRQNRNRYNVQVKVRLKWMEVDIFG